MPGKRPIEAKPPWQPNGNDAENPAPRGLPPRGVSERTPLMKPPCTVWAQPATRPVQYKPKAEEPPVSLKTPILWLRSLSESYSWRLLAMVACTNHLLKGFVAGGGDEGLVGKPIEFIFGELGITAGRLQMLKAAAIAPWALKPAIALVSDAYPICGYKKMPYVIITTVLALIGTSLLGLGSVTTVPAIVAALFLIFLQISSVDLLVEAKQSEEVKQKAKLGPQFFTYTWLGINMGQISAAFLVGALIHYFGPRVPYLVAAPFVALVLWPTLGNFLGERPVPRDECIGCCRLISKHPLLCSLTIMIACLIILLIMATFLLSEAHICALAIGFAAFVLASLLAFIRPEIAGPIAFYFLLGMVSFSTDGALFYFYTDAAGEYPQGPHFSAYFYTTGIGIATFTGITAGFISGAELFTSWSYRAILKVTIVLRATTQLLLVPALLRWTVRVGIPDEFWILAVTFLDQMVFAWRWIPKQVMSAHLTPQGVETTMLGLIAGTFNTAMILSSYLGGFLLTCYGVRPTGQTGDNAMFDHLWKVQVVAALTPCTMLFLLPVFIPAKRQTEPLIIDNRDSATHGSVFEALSQRRSA